MASSIARMQRPAHTPGGLALWIFAGRWSARSPSVADIDENYSAPDILAGRSESLRAALKRYFARRGCPPHETDDLAQEVFLRIVRRGNAEGLENLEGYVFQTAASVFTDRHRHRRVKAADRHEVFEPDRHGGSQPGPDEALLDREALSAIGVALMALPERTRQVFVLRRLEDMSYREIGLRLGLSISGVEKQMLRAVRLLRSRLGDDQ
jgi:RNA polymerase sigma factor (sigma-70 family)